MLELLLYDSNHSTFFYLAPQLPNGHFTLQLKHPNTLFLVKKTTGKRAFFY